MDASELKIPWNHWPSLYGFWTSEGTLDLTVVKKGLRSLYGTNWSPKPVTIYLSMLAQSYRMYLLPEPSLLQNILVMRTVNPETKKFTLISFPIGWYFAHYAASPLAPMEFSVSLDPAPPGASALIPMMISFIWLASSARLSSTAFQVWAHSNVSTNGNITIFTHLRRGQLGYLAKYLLEEEGKLPHDCTEITKDVYLWLYLKDESLSITNGNWIQQENQGIQSRDMLIKMSAYFRGQRNWNSIQVL